MKVIIRIQSPQLNRFLTHALQIERLPRFGYDLPVLDRPLSSPLVVWASTIVTAIAFMCLAMVAGLDANSASSLDQVGQSLLRQVSAGRELEAPKPPAASFPYGSVPPLQSANAPVARPPLVTAQQLR